MTETDNTTEVLEVASIAGHILLENGAEISRVEDTMERIASHYGVDSGHFFVLSNGIFTTGSLGKYANVEFIPIRGIQLSKVVAVNKLSYEIAAGKHLLHRALTQDIELKKKHIELQETGALMRFSGCKKDPAVKRWKDRKNKKT